MSDLMQALREEIRRQTKKAIRADLQKLQKTVAHQRREIAQLKRELGTCGKRLVFLELQERKRISGSSEQSAKSVRFSAKSVRSHRSRLKFVQWDEKKLVRAFDCWKRSGIVGR